MIGKTEEISRSKNKMIENRYPDQMTRLDQLCRQQEIFRTWSRISARMIVQEDDGSGRLPDRRTKHFAGMDNGLVQAPLGNFNDFNELVPGIQESDSEYFCPERGERPLEL